MKQLLEFLKTTAMGGLFVLLPWAPAAFAGSVKIVDGDRISFLEANLGDVSRALGHWGVGVRELLTNKEK